MDEYMKINWKENPLEDISFILSKDDLAKSYINQWTEATVSKEDLNLKNPVTEKVSFSVPGQRFYTPKKPLSKFNKSEHVKLINAHKFLTTGKKTHDGFEKEDLAFYNAVRSLVLTENAQYLKLAEQAWNKSFGKHPLKLKQALSNYALQERLKRLKVPFGLPQHYKHVDTISYTYSETDTAIEMFLKESVLDVGKVPKFFPPELMHTYIYKVNTLPVQEENVYYSKLPVSQDKHIEEIMKSHDVDVVISLSSLKKLIDFNGNTAQWIMPVVIKETRNTNGLPGKKVIFVDKPLPKIQVKNVDLNKRCAKLFTRTNFCCMDSISYSEDIVCGQNSVPGEAANSTEMKKEGATPNRRRIMNNASYKIWSLGQKVENSTLIKGFKHVIFKVLIRTKVDAYEVNEQGNVLPVIVVPKLEYQLNFGASICTKSELAKAWTSLFFQPFSNLYRVRSDFSTGEVVKIESCSMQKINNEAFTNHSTKPHLGLGVLYKVFYDLKQWPEGNYILNYKGKQGAFMDLLQEKMDRNSFDLHNFYKENSKVVADELTPWSPIDVNVLLPIFEHNGHMCGLLTPCNPKPNNAKRQWKNKNHLKKKGKFGKKKATK